jgi:hypothetical protein
MCLKIRGTEFAQHLGGTRLARAGTLTLQQIYGKAKVARASEICRFARHFFRFGARVAYPQQASGHQNKTRE